jgi:hypothetical protein
MDLRLLTVTVNYGELDKDEQVCNNNNSFVNLNNGDQNNKNIQRYVVRRSIIKI